ncbi:MAG: hypothetical protein ABII00_02115 [Elusimicrobiota bacterium]
MQELIQKIGQAKAYIDNGMCRVGPRLRRGLRAESLMSGGAGRSLALADAVVQLCRQDHPNEALPVLRHLIEMAAVMRWVAVSEDAERDAAVVLDATDDARWEDLWSSERLLERARRGGIPEEEVRRVLALCGDFTRGGRAAVPWAHLFPENLHAGADARTVLSLTVRMMGHVLKALDTRWPAAFPGAEAMWA